MLDTTTGVWKIESGKFPAVPEKINEEAPCEAFPLLIIFFGLASGAGKGKCGVYLVSLTLGATTETMDSPGAIWVFNLLVTVCLKINIYSVLQPREKSSIGSPEMMPRMLELKFTLWLLKCNVNTHQ